MKKPFCNLIIFVFISTINYKWSVSRNVLYFERRKYVVGKKFQPEGLIIMDMFISNLCVCFFIILSSPKLFGCLFPFQLLFRFWPVSLLTQVDKEDEKSKVPSFFLLLFYSVSVPVSLALLFPIHANNNAKSTISFCFSYPCAQL